MDEELSQLFRHRSDLYFMYMNMTQVYEYLSECIQSNNDCEFREELLQRIQGEYDVMREEYDHKICSVTQELDSLLGVPDHLLHS
jgi:hypothetical protein